MNDSLSNLLSENRTFPPTPEFAAQANAKADMYEEAERDRLAFWEKQAANLYWHKKWETVLDWQPPFAKWFVGGKLNASYNALDRHVLEGRGDRVAFLFEGEPGDTRTITYAELLTEVKKAANALLSLGIKDGDRVAIYMPMIPEAAIAMLACARIGAVHCVVFGGFSPDSLASRIDDSQAKLVITADQGMRGRKTIPLKENVDAALTFAGTSSVEKMIVVHRTGHPIQMKAQRDLWYHMEIMTVTDICPPEAMNAEDPLFILYTSGSTGKPKGVLHTTGGYLTYVNSTLREVFDIKQDDVFGALLMLDGLQGILMCFMDHSLTVLPQ